KLPIGAGEQMLVDINMPGGSKIVQDFGNKAADIRWTGKFYGPNIAFRVQQLRAYRISGVPQTLIWGNEQYYVLIKSFDPGYMGGHNEYEIVLNVIQSLNGAFESPTFPSIDQQVTGLQSLAATQNSAIVAADPVGAQSFQQQLANVVTTIAQYAPLAQNIIAGGSPITVAIQAALSELTVYQSSISPLASQFAYVMGLIGSLQSIADNVQQGSTLSQLPAYGGELFSFAARQYGDVTQAFNISQANSRVYPLLNPQLLKTIGFPPAA
ncbi:MAG: hypothetical protein KGL39_32965, partial [Patescibacteria group bacterium]|nr:hypothetical protein [Patescibacteria group bacterium]